MRGSCALSLSRQSKQNVEISEEIKREDEDMDIVSMYFIFK
jgi:hypothetical protein